MSIQRRYLVALERYLASLGPGAAEREERMALALASVAHARRFSRLHGERVAMAEVDEAEVDDDGSP